MNFETIPKKDAFGKFECGYPKVTTENLPNADFSERPKVMSRLLAVSSLSSMVLLKKPKKAFSPIEI